MYPTDSYAGEYKNGIRQGLGLRTSVPYGEVINFFPEEAAAAAEMALAAKRKAGEEQFASLFSGGLGNGGGVNGGRISAGVTRRGSWTSQRSGDAIGPDGELEEMEEPYSSEFTPPPLSFILLALSSNRVPALMVLVNWANEISTSVYPRQERRSCRLRQSERYTKASRFVHLGKVFLGQGSPDPDNLPVEPRPGRFILHGGTARDSGIRSRTI
ncbi:unnamed protein product [Protopolystoma xenopodis]|uniref:Uncharacterized protein n=1 Tax=Protopolystoma xenopodis TaxID=117903 RepID=A0A448WB65_9PLAT|nr:unnamed protein product [Protopolystoma xenopodis]